VTGVPPSPAGADQVTVACPWPAVAVVTVGAPGAVAAAGMTVLEEIDSALLPMVLVAWTVKL
jgi:hypothetical protein